MKRKKGDGSVFQRGAVWWIKYYRNGKPYRETSGSDKESEARKLLKKRLGEIVLGRFVGPDAERVTIRELAEAIPDRLPSESKKRVSIKPSE